MEHVEHSKLLYNICYRLVKEITFHKWYRRRGNRADAPDLTEEEIAGGQKNVCPMRWTKRGIEALHKETEAYMMGLMEDTNRLAIHVCHYTVQPRDIQLARRIRGEANWDVRDYTV